MLLIERQAACLWRGFFLSEIARQITEQGGDDALALKGNPNTQGAVTLVDRKLTIVPTILLSCASGP
jgi:hypothetical protein